MAKKTKNSGPPGLTIDYEKMGMMTIDEFKQALWTDLQILKEQHAVKYVDAPKLRLKPTDEFGDSHTVRRQRDGKAIFRMHTRHYRPACMDYDFRLRTHKAG